MHPKPQQPTFQPTPTAKSPFLLATPTHYPTWQPHRANINHQLGPHTYRYKQQSMDTNMQKLMTLLQQQKFSAHQMDGPQNGQAGVPPSNTQSQPGIRSASPSCGGACSANTAEISAHNTHSLQPATIT